MRTLILVAVLGLAACNDEPEVKLNNATPAQVAAEVEKSGGTGEMRFEPGQWRVETKLTDVATTGMPAQVAAQMKSSMQSMSSESQCLTPEQASRPSSQMFAGKQGGSCKYETFELSDGKLKATMACPDASGAKMSMTMDGDYTRTSYEVDATMRMQSAAQGQSMNVTFRSTGTRTGECATSKG